MPFLRVLLQHQTQPLSKLINIRRGSKKLSEKKQGGSASRHHCFVQTPPFKTALAVMSARGLSPQGGGDLKGLSFFFN